MGVYQTFLNLNILKYTSLFEAKLIDILWPRHWLSHKNLINDLITKTRSNSNSN